MIETNAVTVVRGARRASVIVLMVLALVPVRAAAQHGAVQPLPPDSASNTGRMVVGGIMGGLAGAFLGGALGFALSSGLDGSCQEYCGLAGGALGAAAGETIGMAMGVHTGNNRQGGLGAALTGPVIVVVAAMAAAGIFADANVPPIAVAIVIPAAQLYTSILGEQAAAGRR